MSLSYRTFSDFLAERFDCKMQKLTVDAGFSCPNRDGTLSTGGCIYCNNSSFTPVRANGDSVAAQIARSKEFFARKYPSMRYLAYFQAYTGTHAPVDTLLRLYSEALAQPDVDGLIIGTRPDCMPQQLLDRLAEMRRSTFVMVEYGAETAHNSTLDRINRCHSWQQTVDAVRRTHEAGIETGLHFINGLPGESEDMIMATVGEINTLPVDVVKFHQMQVVKGTLLARQYLEGKADILEFTVERYLNLCVRIIKSLRADIAIERFVSQSPADMLLCPRWGLKNHEFTDKLNSLLRASTACGCAHSG